jgi:hypothetical protein
MSGSDESPRSANLPRSASKPSGGEPPVGDARVPGHVSGQPLDRSPSRVSTAPPEGGRRRGSSLRACRRDTPASAVGRGPFPMWTAGPGSRARPVLQRWPKPDDEDVGGETSRRKRPRRAEAGLGDADGGIRWSHASPAEAGWAALAGRSRTGRCLRATSSGSCTAGRSQTARPSRGAIPAGATRTRLLQRNPGTGTGPALHGGRRFAVLTRHLHPLPSGRTGSLRGVSDPQTGAGSAPPGDRFRTRSTHPRTGCSNQPASALVRRTCGRTSWSRFLARYPLS